MPGRWLCGRDLDRGALLGEVRVVLLRGLCDVAVCPGSSAHSLSAQLPLLTPSPAAAGWWLSRCWCAVAALVDRQQRPPPGARLTVHSAAWSLCTAVIPASPLLLWIHYGFQTSDPLRRTLAGLCALGPVGCAKATLPQLASLASTWVCMACDLHRKSAAASGRRLPALRR